MYDAEYGRAIAQVNVSTKSGSNKVRGTAFEFLRNSRLDAKNYFDRPTDPIPPFKRNQYGFTFSGPVVLPKIVDGRNKLFFMANFEGLRENKALTQNPSLPLTAWRTGDFSNLRDASGALIPIYDPATRVFDAAGNVLQAPTAFNEGKYASINLLCTPVKNVMIGGEFQWAQRKNLNDFKPNDYRVQFSFKYSFSAKVTGE